MQKNLTLEKKAETSKFFTFISIIQFIFIENFKSSDLVKNMNDSAHQRGCIMHFFGRAHKKDLISKNMEGKGRNRTSEPEVKWMVLIAKWGAHILE